MFSKIISGLNKIYKVTQDKLTHVSFSSFQELPSDNEDSGPPSMAPPPLPADYTGGAKNDVSAAPAASNMGWNMAAPAAATTQPQTSAFSEALLPAAKSQGLHSDDLRSQPSEHLLLDLSLTCIFQQRRPTTTTGATRTGACRRPRRQRPPPPPRLRRPPAAVAARRTTGRSTRQAMQIPIR